WHTQRPHTQDSIHIDLALRKIEKKKFSARGSGPGEGELALATHARTIAFLQIIAVHADISANNLDPCLSSRRESAADTFSARQLGNIQLGILVDDSGLPVNARLRSCKQTEPSPLFRRRKRDLLVRRLQIFGGGSDPDLDGMRGAGFGCVPFAVYDAITCRHRLHFIRPQNVGFPPCCPGARSEEHTSELQSRGHLV